MFPFRYVTDAAADLSRVHLFRNGLHQFCDGCTTIKPRGEAAKLSESSRGQEKRTKIDFETYLSPRMRNESAFAVRAAADTEKAAQIPLPRNRFPLA